jgi:hypothetical protein
VPGEKLYPFVTPRPRKRSPLVLAAALLTLAVPVLADDGLWRRIGDDVPMPRGAVSLPNVYDVARNRMIVLAGGAVWSIELGLTPPRFTAIPTTGVPPLASTRAIYDAAHDRLVCYPASAGGDVAALDLLGPATWSRITLPGTGPGFRSRHALVYDPAGQRMILTGGGTSEATGSPWQLTLGASPAWTPISAIGPAAGLVFEPAVAYDPVRHAMVHFSDGGTPPTAPAWILDLATHEWRELVAEGIHPTPIQGATLVHDPVADRFILYNSTLGGVPTTFTLDLDGAPQWTVLGGGQPESGIHPAIAFDPASSRMVVYGGGFGGAPVAENIRLHVVDIGAGAASATEVPRRIEPVAGATAVLDAGRREVIAFGGRDGPNSCRADVWIRSLDDDAGWLRVLGGTGAPAPRELHSAAWDPARSRMWIFGGSSGSPRNDLRALDRSGDPQWLTLGIGGPAPSPRMRAAMVYDPVRDQLVLFGGDDGLPHNDVHAIPLSGPDALRWGPVAPAGTPPTGRYGSAMVHDPVADRLLVFGGRRGSTWYDDVWSLDLSGTTAQWSAVATIGTRPSPRDAHVAVYDAARHRIVLFGGRGPSGELQDAWELALSGSTPEWRALTPSGDLPPARREHVGVFDPVADRLVVFGGATAAASGETIHGDTWEIDFGANVGVVDREPGVTAFRVTPNPSRGAIELAFSARAPGAAQVAVWDLAGRRVQARTVTVSAPGAQGIALDLGAAAPGLYFATLDFEGTRRLARFTRLR